MTSVSAPAAHQQVFSLAPPPQRANCIASYRGLNQGDMTEYSDNHEIVISTTDPYLAIERCATQKGLPHKRVVNVIQDSNAINGLRKTRYYLFEGFLVGDTDNIAVYEPQSHRFFHAEGKYKSMGLGLIHVFNLQTGAITEYPCQVASLKNRGNKTPEESGIFRELSLMKKFAGERGVAQCIGTYTYTSLKGRVRQALIMPYYNQGSLNDDLRKSSPDRACQYSCIPPHILRTIQLDWLRGLETIHAKNLLHRDIKSANLFINSNSGVITGVIGDFGFTTQLPLDCRKTGTFPCTLFYAAPELIIFQRTCAAKQCVDEATEKNIFSAYDIWSIGTVFSVLLNEDERPNELIKHIFGLKRPEDESTLKSRLAFFYTQKELLNNEPPFNNLFPEPANSNSFAHIVWEMLRPNPESRITAEKACGKWNARIQMANQTDASSELSPIRQIASPITTRKNTPGATPTDPGASPTTPGATPTDPGASPTTPRIAQGKEPTPPTPVGESP